MSSKYSPPPTTRPAVISFPAFLDAALAAFLAPDLAALAPDLANFLATLELALVVFFKADKAPAPVFAPPFIRAQAAELVILYYT